MSDIRNTDCTNCVAHTGCNSVCLMGTPIPKPIMVVLDMPNAAADAAGKVTLTGDNSLLVDVLTKALKIPLVDVYFTYLVKCRKDNWKPSEKEVGACSEYLLAEIELVDPTVIILVGGTALNGFKTDAFITKEHGRPFDISIGTKERTFLPVYSPSYVRHGAPHLFKEFAKDLLKAKAMCYDMDDLGGDTKIVDVDTPELLETLIKYVKDTKVASIDFETTGLNHFDPTFTITSMSITFQAGSAWVLPLDHFENKGKDGWDWVSAFIRVFDAIILNADIEKVAHNAKYELHCLAWFIRTHYKEFIGKSFIRGQWHDPMLQHSILVDNVKHGLKELTATFYPNLSGYEEAVAKYKWDAIPWEKQAWYNGMDTDLTLRFRLFFEALLGTDRPALPLYYNLTIPALYALVEMELNGLKVDTDLMREGIAKVEAMIVEENTALQAIPTVATYIQSKKDQALADMLESVTEKYQKLVDESEAAFASKMEKLEERIAKYEAEDKTHTKTYTNAVTRLNEIRTGIISRTITKTELKYAAQLEDLNAGKEELYEFNYRSTNDLNELLYTEAGFNFRKIYNYKKKTKGGTGEDIILQLGDTSGFVEKLVLCRSLSKTLSTYLYGILNRCDSNGYIHSSFNQHSVRTGRLSSSNPNVQNIPNPARQTHPKAQEAAIFIKSCFTVPEGYTMVQLDFSQAELRVIAYKAQCKAMLDGYDADKDMHSLTASNVMGISLEEFYKLPKDVQKMKRFQAKAVNFGFIYGQSAEGFQEYAFNDYGISFTIEECRQIRQAFFKSYPELLVYHATQIAKGQKYGHVRTVFGRTRKVPNINGYDQASKSADERVAINSPIQGTAGELTVFGLAVLRNRVSPRSLVVNSIHDSIMYYIPDDILDDELRVMRFTLENLPIEEYFGVTLRRTEEKRGVSMKVDIETSKKSWYHLEDYELAR